MKVFGRSLRYPVGLCLLALALIVAGDSPLTAGQAPLGPAYKRLDGTLREVLAAQRRGPQRVIIRTKSGQRDSVRRLLASRDSSLLAEHAIDAVTAIINGDDLARLANHEGVLSVSTDAVVTARGGLLGGLLGGLVQTVTQVVGGLTDTVGGLLGSVVGIISPATYTEGPPVPPQVLRDTLGLDSRWTGRGVGVAVIDSGLEMSAEFTGRVRAFYDFTGGKTLSTYPSDEYGHGTHVAGTIGGSGALSADRNYRGLAPNVTFTIIKVLDANGAGFTSDVIRAVDFAVANRSWLGIDIINLSLGHPIYEPAATDPLVLAVERASKAGIIVVAAAGNMGMNPETGVPGYAGITSPGNAPSAITAGAVMARDTVARTDDRIPDYSSSGPTVSHAMVKPDVLAPGRRIIAVASKRGTLYRNHPNLKAADTDYMRLSGTSMATGVTTGVIALMMEAHDTTLPGTPALTPNATKGALQYTALTVRNDYGIQYDPLRQGAGALNGRG